MADIRETDLLSNPTEVNVTFERRVSKSYSTGFLILCALASYGQERFSFHGVLEVAKGEAKK